MGASYAKESLGDSDCEFRNEVPCSAGASPLIVRGPKGSKNVEDFCNSQDVPSDQSCLQKTIEMPFELKKRSKSLDAGCNRNPPNFGPSGGRGSRVERFRRRSRKKSVDCLEGERRKMKKGVESLEEASNEEEESEEEPPKELTERQKEVIKETWKIMEASMTKVGVVMFMGLFETHPDVQEVFLPFRGLASKELKESKQLRSHALRVMGLVEKAVVRLDKPRVLVPLVEECGRNHCGYGVKMEQLDLVGPQFLNAIQPTLTDHWNKETEEAWTVFMVGLVYLMKKAMRQKLASG